MFVLAGELNRLDRRGLFRIPRSFPAREQAPQDLIGNGHLVFLDGYRFISSARVYDSQETSPAILHTTLGDLSRKNWRRSSGHGLS